MGKAILVIEAPASCIDCPCYKGGNILRCGVNFQSLTDKEIRKKPDWCTLRQIPDKKEKVVRTGICYEYDEGYEDGEVSGWNKCIDTITGDK